MLSSALGEVWAPPALFAPPGHAFGGGAHARAVAAVAVAVVAALLLRAPAPGSKAQRSRRRVPAAAAADTPEDHQTVPEDPRAVPLLAAPHGACALPRCPPRVQQAHPSVGAALSRNAAVAIPRKLLAADALRPARARRASEFDETLLRPRPGRAAVPIAAHVWELPQARGVTLLVHGLNGHARHASNLWTAHSLLNAGFTVVALDVEGHGRSGGVRGYVPDSASRAARACACVRHMREC